MRAICVIGTGPSDRPAARRSGKPPAAATMVAKPAKADKAARTSNCRSPTWPMKTARRSTLITPPAFDLEVFPGPARRAFWTAAEIACLRLSLATQGRRHPVARRRCAAREVAHARDVAIVIDSHVLLVERLGLDGVHLTDGARSVRKVRKDLGADAIVGAFCGTSRHEGMSAGEAGADYVAFGPIGRIQRLATAARWTSTLFEWWSRGDRGAGHRRRRADGRPCRPLGPVTDFFGDGRGNLGRG